MTTPIPVGRVISLAGFVTSLGGGSLSPGVRGAMLEAASGSWRPEDLQRWASDEIAAVTGAEAGWVTSGAAAGLTLGIAACIARTDAVALDRLPSPARRRPPRVLMQRGHRNDYDRVVRLSGAEILEVGYPGREGVGITYPRDIEAALTEDVVAIAHLATAEDSGVALPAVAAIARRHGVPLVVDAAAELPPLSNLRAFLADGADLVVFSGGKAIRGPQATGVIAGRSGLIASVRLQTLDMDIDAVAWRELEGADPPHHGLGRPMKVGKEEIAGLVAALHEFTSRDHDAERLELRAWLGSIAAGLGDRETFVDDRAHFYPRLTIPVGDEARQIAARLAGASPSIVVPHAPLQRSEIVVCPEAVDHDDRTTVERALMESLA